MLYYLIMINELKQYTRSPDRLKEMDPSFVGCKNLRILQTSKVTDLEDNTISRGKSSHNLYLTITHIDTDILPSRKVNYAGFFRTSHIDKFRSMLEYKAYCPILVDGNKYFLLVLCDPTFSSFHMLCTYKVKGEIRLLYNPIMPITHE